MEQILAFVLGAGAVVLIWGVVVAFKTARKVNDVESAITDIYQNMREYDELTNRRIDQEIDRVDRIYQDCISFTDSRVDKLEAKIVGNLMPKEILKG
jgi:ATP-dependent Zn protease